MKLRVSTLVLALVLPVTPLAVALAQAPPSSSTVRLSVSPAGSGGTFDFGIRSPYGTQAYTVFALSPGRNAFPVADGTTDSSGGASLSLVLLDEPGLDGQNLSFYAEVGTPQGTRSSPWVHVRASAFASPTRTSFTLAEGAIAFVEDVATDWVELADIDRDGDLDALLAGVRTTPADEEGVTYIRVFENDGNGQFTETTETAIVAEEQRSASRLFVEDVTGDGYDDFMVTPTFDDSFENGLDLGVSLYVNDGTGAFQRQAAFPNKSETGLRPFTIAFGDIDGDGDLDAYVGDRFGAAHTEEVPDLQKNELLINDGSGNFTPDATFFADDTVNPLSLTRSASFGDIDNDGALDLYVANSGGNLLLRNQGDGSFVDVSDRLPPAAESTWGAQFADVDSDGDLDILLGNTAFNPFAQAVVLNRGGSQAGTLGEFESGFFPFPVEGQALLRLGLEVTDINGDGSPDVLFPTHELGSGEIPDLYVNQAGSGAYVLDTEFEALRGIHSRLAPGDLDGDGDVDLLAPKTNFIPVDAAQIYVLFNETFESTDAPMAWLRGDAHNDRTQDLSDAIFILNTLFRGSNTPGCLAAIDVNNDTLRDISDPVYLLNFLFQGNSPPPPAPHPEYGDAESSLTASCDRVEIFVSP